MVIEGFEKAELATCLPFLLEAGCSALSEADHRTVMDRLEQLPHVAIDSEVERLALETQRELAGVGHHRVPMADVMIAACAHRAGSGVLHYDRDYDLIVEHTGLVYESLWIAEPGSL
jgi:predicted nucleic acid-binding protein